MAEQARLRAEMRRRKLLAKSEERMRKVLGSSADASPTHKPALDDEWRGGGEFQMPEDKFGMDDQDSSEDQTGTDNTPNEGGHYPATSPAIQLKSYHHICGGVAFITGAISRLCAYPGLFFVSFITLEAAALLPAMYNQQKTSSALINLWTLIVGNYLSIDINNTKCFLVLSAVETSLQRLFFHSFSFILVHSLIEGFS